MVQSRKIRAEAFVMPERAAGPGVNDNIPGIVAGHSMPELDNAPRQPAAENLLHYVRIAEIGSFPEGVAPQAGIDDSTAAAIDAVPEKAAAFAPKRAVRTFAASLCSCIAHAAVFGLLAVTMVAVPEEPVEEAGSIVSVTLLGDAELDQLAAGEPELVEAEAVEPETVTPTEPEPVTAQTAQPVEAVTPQPVEVTQPVQPTETQPVEAEPVVVTDEPEVLAAIVPAEPVVSQPVPVMAPVEPTEPVDTPKPETVVPIEKPEAKKPEVKPEPKKPVARQKPKPVDKPKKKDVAKKGGSRGQSAEDRKRGTVDGSAADGSQDGSRSAGRNSFSAGSAAVANYPGKVQSKIRRSVRVPSAFRREKASLSVRVRLTIGSSGQLSSVAVARSSGVGELDQAVVDGVRRAAPFPPLPPEWGKPSWTFTQEVQVTGR